MLTFRLENNMAYIHLKARVRNPDVTNCHLNEAMPLH